MVSRSSAFVFLAAFLTFCMAAFSLTATCQTMQGSDGSQSKMQTGSSTRNGSATGDLASGSNARLGSQYRPPVPTKVASSTAEQVARSAAEIDRLVDQHLKSQGVRANSMTDDYQFVRRVYLDITGTIPTGRQVMAFTHSRTGSKSAKLQKRIDLIDELLNSDGHISHSFNYWADILRLTDVASRNDIRPYGDWVKDSLAADMPYDQFVYQLMSAEGRVFENPPVGYVLRDIGMNLASLDNTMRVFLGTRVGCAQCHNHPFDSWTQKEFYQLAAFIHGTDTQSSIAPIRDAIKPAVTAMENLPETPENDARKNQLNRLLDVSLLSVGEKPQRKLRLPKDYQYDDAKPRDLVQPKVVFGKQPTLKPKTSRRQAFADWIVSPDNPRFTLTIANRLWKRVFGVGVIEPVDDITDQTEPANQELMDFLVAEFKRVNYSQREFLRILYNTEAYQREAFTDDWNLSKPYHFAGPMIRRMTAEQLWDSMLTLTLKDPDLYQRPPGEDNIRLVAVNPGEQLTLAALEQRQAEQKRESGKEGKAAALAKTHSHKGVLLVRASEMRQPEYPSHFLQQFGQGDRQIIGGSSTDGHVPQILTMFNGPISHKLLYKGTVIYDDVAAAGNLSDQIDVIFLSILGREPTRKDKKIAAAEINSLGPAGVGNVIWALLNTREFMFIN